MSGGAGTQCFGNLRFDMAVDSGLQSSNSLRHLRSGIINARIVVFAAMGGVEGYGTRKVLQRFLYRIQRLFPFAAYLISKAARVNSGITPKTPRVGATRNEQ